MALSRYEIQKKSDAKRGIVTRGYKLPAAVVAQIPRLAKERGQSQAAVIAEAIALLTPQPSEQEAVALLP